MAYQKKEEIAATPMNVMFTDIETVPQYARLREAPQQFQDLFEKKFQKDVEAIGDRNIHTDKFEEELQEYYESKASFHAEFGKIVCVSFGILIMEGIVMKLKIKTIAGRDEKKILTEAAAILLKATFLCAHNGINFDFGFMARRYLINKMPIPIVLNTMGRKPWEVNLIDTMQLWGFLSFNYTCSLDTLAFLFDLPSPKDQVSGKDVYSLYYHKNKTDELPWEGEEERLAIIAEYCGKDVITLANVYLSITQWAVVAPENVVK
jgi:3'-5' exonuclease